MHAVEGFGKTSFAAFSPNPIFLTTESGIETLIHRGRLPETAHLPRVARWRDVLGLVDELASSQHDYKTLVIDTLNGVEKLCHEHVCGRDFNGEFNEKGFLAYARGYEVATSDWREFLIRLEKIKDVGMGVVALCHTRIANFKNPEGPDYDRYQADLHAKTWSLTHKAADEVLFGNFAVNVDRDKRGDRAKARSGGERVLHTEWSAAYDAKNRYGLPAEIDVSSTGKYEFEGKEAWENFLQAIKESKKKDGE